MAIPVKTQFRVSSGSGGAPFNRFVMPGSSTGDVYYVHHSGTSTGPGYEPASAFSTIAAALTACTASNGDTVVVLPHHAESISSAGAITCSKAGVTVLGLGEGHARPLITWHTTDASWLITAAGVTIRNIRTTVDVDEVVSMFAVSAAGVTFDAVDHIDAGATQALQFLLTTAAADYLTIKNCRHVQFTAAGSAQKWIQLVGTDFTRIVDNTFLILAFAATTSHLISGSTAVVWCEVSRNMIMFTGATITIVMNFVTGSTGIVSENRIGSGTSVATAAVITGDGVFCFQNFWVDDAAASGLLAPGVGSD